MKLSAVLLIAFITFETATYAVAQCGATRAPVLRGIALGMNRSKVEAVIGQPIKLEDKRSAAVYFYLDPKTRIEKLRSALIYIGESRAAIKLESPTNEKLKGVEIIQLTFYKERLKDFFISYDPGYYPYKKIHQLRDSLTALHDLPSTVWDTDENERTAWLNCSTFKLGAIMGEIPESQLFQTGGTKNKGRARPKPLPLVLVSLSDNLLEAEVNRAAAEALKAEDKERARRKAEQAFKP